MTLNTSVYILDNDDPHEIFHFCQELIDTPKGIRFIDKERISHTGKPTGIWDLRNPSGIGLNAWLWINYKPGEMLGKPGEHHEFCEDYDDCNCPPPHWFEVTFDTGYGYSEEERGCGSLHASLVAKLGMWLDSRGTRWAWNNEFTGETHIGDRYEHLFDLINGGEEAFIWFTEIVKPLIESGILILPDKELE